MIPTGRGSSERTTLPSPNTSVSEGENSGAIVVSALFADMRSASAAIQELRDIGVPAASISMISRDEERASEVEAQGLSGVAREEVREEGLTYRPTAELPNDEDLPTTSADMTGRSAVTPSAVTDFEAPPDQLSGGVEGFGLSRDAGMVRKNEGDPNADEDIYSDFPDQPGGINPISPAAQNARTDVQEPVGNETSVARNAAVGAGLGSVVGLLAGLAGLAIPGIGPFVAAGPLAALLSGLTTGGVAGGVIGALSSMGLPEEHARAYAAAIEQGHTLVSVQTDPLSRDHVERVLTANGGEQVS